MKFGLTDSELGFLQKTVIEPLKALGAQVWIFGSRSRGDYKKFSDVDILFKVEKLPTGFMGELTERLEVSNFPYKVDIVKFDEIAPSYKDNIMQDLIKL